MTRGAAVLIPVKDFTRAKERLGAVLAPAERARLAEEMATTVVRAGSPLPVHVVCDDPAVRAWAERAGATALWTPGLGLNGAVETGVSLLADSGFDRAIVAHSDLPRARSLAWLADFDGVTIVPDRHRDGTNVLVVPTTAGFRFGYGPSSFTRHRSEARRLGLTARIVADAELAIDVDRPDDLAEIGDLLGVGETSSP